MTSDKFDVIVFGASGFVGKLIVEHMHRTYGIDGDVKWAAAGRNREKLRRALTETMGAEEGGALPVIVADSQDGTSLRAMVEQTSVVCTTVGPYAKYGTLLVQVCAELGTHYVDLTGELHWMRQTIDRYHSLAEKSGARIVHCCGFESVPSDLGSLYVQNAMFARHGVYATKVKSGAVSLRGGISGGTMATNLNEMKELREDPSICKLLTDPYALNPPEIPWGADGIDRTGAVYDEDVCQWTSPFVFAPVDTRVVRRTHALLGNPWAANFSYTEAMFHGDGAWAHVAATLMALAVRLFKLLTYYAPTRYLLEKLVPAGDGPSREVMTKGFFKYKLTAFHPTDPRKNLEANISGSVDPGYMCTAKMIAESAVCLAKDDLDTPSGILTPAVAMGDKLIGRLQEHARMTFSIVE